MRKIAILVGAVALLTMLVAGAAFAVNKQCSAKPCFGTNQEDTLFERGGNGVGDEIYGRKGPDRIFATSFTNDVDYLDGGRGNDRLDARDGDGRDTLNGGPGLDRCFGDPGDEFIQCEFINGVVQ
jgi:RTX calcium-binding nonapeptide repeat (4 copies)